jgi:hypothetical protein
MITIRKNTVRGFRVASWILLYILQASTAAALDARPAKIASQTDKRTLGRRGGERSGFVRTAKKYLIPPPTTFRMPRLRRAHAPVRHFKFSHLTTNDGLSQGYVTAIWQDRRSFMWFATRDGLNRYDGNTFVVYKNNPNDPTSLSSNFIQALMGDDHGDLWIATNTGVNRFDPTIERFSRYH